MRTFIFAVLTLCAAIVAGVPCQAQGNLLKDPSFEVPKERDQFRLVFALWGGWIYEGDCDFHVGQIAHTGNTSALLTGAGNCKIRIRQEIEVEPGRYRVTAYIRGLDIGSGQWNATTEFSFANEDGMYFQLGKNGTFGWTPLTFVADVTEKKKIAPSFGLMAPGYFWIDDVSLEKVGQDVPLTPTPVLGEEIAPIAPPERIDPAKAVRCVMCQCRNHLEWKTCFACGTALPKDGSVTDASDEPPIRTIDISKFTGGTLTEDKQALRLTQGYASLEGRNNWSDYDTLLFETDVEGNEPALFTIEVRDEQTTGYWTRVNYESVLLPGKSTFTLPLNQLYVGEKSRPGRNLLLDKITRFVLVLRESKGAVTFSEMRLVRNEKPPMFDGLWAFDFGPPSGPVMDGFTPITPGTLYSEARGFGLKDAKVWRTFDMLQPEPLYRDCIAVESGGLAVDLPNGKYRVVLNLNHPGGFWGENQIYHERTVLANGVPVVQETMNAEKFYARYFRFLEQDDLPTDNTFDKYQKDAYDEKVFDVEVKEGQIFLEFRGANWANCVTSVIVYPVERAEEGEAFLSYITEKRRFYFDNSFKRILHPGTGDQPEPTAEEVNRGYVMFQREFMEDIYYNDTPRQGEPQIKRIYADAFAGEYTPVTFSLVPLRNLGDVSVKVSDLQGPEGTIPAKAIDIGYISYRLSRVTMDGSVYTIAPRLLMPRTEVEMPQGITRTFQLTFKTPKDAVAGIYTGQVTVSENSRDFVIPIRFNVRKGTLDEADIPVGPWGHAVNMPWQEDAASRALYERFKRGSLEKIREYGFNCVTGIPRFSYRGFNEGKPVFDFSQTDADMKLLRELGFMATCDYGAGIQGINKYYIDEAAMNAAGMTGYSEFIKAVYTAIQQHAESADWIPVYYYLADEPVDGDMLPSILNAEAYHKAFPQGPPFFTGASSYAGNDPDDPHMRFARAYQVVSWNDHSEDSLRLLREAGGNWAFYNGSNRWTMGYYMYKCVREYDMKFRLVWHFNAAAGNPYYALDCREDDYAWANASPDGVLIPSVEFERLREGLTDYRRLITLERLAKEKGDAAGLKQIESRMQRFRMGQRDHDEILPPCSWYTFRMFANEAIERLR